MSWVFKEFQGLQVVSEDLRSVTWGPRGFREIPEACHEVSRGLQGVFVELQEVLGAFQGICGEFRGISEIN